MSTTVIVGSRWDDGYVLGVETTNGQQESNQRCNKRKERRVLGMKSLTVHTISLSRDHVGGYQVPNVVEQLKSVRMRCYQHQHQYPQRRRYRIPTRYFSKFCHPTQTNEKARPSSLYLKSNLTHARRQRQQLLIGTINMLILLLSTIKITLQEIPSTLPTAMAFLHKTENQQPPLRRMGMYERSCHVTTSFHLAAIAMTRTNNDDEFDDNDNENEKGSSLNHNGENKKVQRRRKYWVVVVDDEEDLRLAVGDFLFDKGYHVTACSDAPALLEVCNEILADQQQQQTTARIDNTDRDDKQQSQEYENQSRLLQRSNGTRTGTRLPDAIISDVRMPGGPTGIELVKMIRSHPSPELRTIPIVLLTAKALTQDRIEGYKAGADFYLPKPFSPDELVSIVDNMISRKEQRKQAAEMVTAASTSLSTDRNDRRESISPLHIPDLLTLKQELEEIKGIMKQNAASVVQKTDVYLTDAEREVLDLVCDGYTNAEIAEHCGVGIIKMNRMILKLYEKTQTRTRTELVRWAVSTGYVS